MNEMVSCNETMPTVESMNNAPWMDQVRDKIVPKLTSALARATTGSVDVFVVEGPSNECAAVLFEEFQKSSDALFSSGVFDTHSKNPFSAIKSAISGLIEIILQKKNLSAAIYQCISTELSLYDRIILMQVFPNTFEFLNIQMDDSDWSMGCALEFMLTRKEDALTKLKFAVRTILRIFSQCSENSLILCFFDLHWADEESLDILDLLINDNHQSRLILVGTCCVENLCVEHCVRRWKQKDDVFDPKARTFYTFIELEYINPDDLNMILANVLNLPMSKTQLLSNELCSRTNGRRASVRQELEIMKKRNIICFNRVISQWEWDLEALQRSSIAFQDLDQISAQFLELPDDVQRFLKIGACLGFKFCPEAVTMVKTAISGPPFDINEALSSCVDAMFLIKMCDDKIIFTHENVRETVLRHITLDCKLEPFHYTIAMLLLPYLYKGESYSDDCLAFICADQFSMALCQFNNTSDRFECAKLFYHVGQKCIQASAFTTAAQYLEYGTRVLEQIDKAWKDYGELSESMYASYAEVLYYTGSFEVSLKKLKQLLIHKPSKTIAMRANLTRLHILKAECKLKEFVNQSFIFLEYLGVKPSHPMSGQGQFQLERTMRKMSSMSDDDILSLPRVRDLDKIIIMEIFTLMWIPLETLGLVQLSPIIMCKAVLLSIKYGISKLSPEAFTLLGTYLISEKNMLIEGYRMGELAIKLSRKIDPSHVDARVINLVYSMTKPWQRVNLSQCIPPLLESHNTALMQGDPFTAFMAINIYLCIGYLSSMNLSLLLTETERYAAQILEYRQKTVFLQILPLWQCVMNLIGKTDDPLNFEQGEAIDKQHLVGNPTKVGEQARWSYLMQLAFYMGDLRKSSEMYVKLKSLNIGFMKAHAFYQVRVFFFGLIAMKNSRNGNDYCERDEAIKYKDILRSWVKKGATQLTHKLYIMEAEYNSLSSTNGLLLKCDYDRAIESSLKSGYLQDTALAAQLAGEALSRYENTFIQAKSYFLQSRTIWLNWGAKAVADKLTERLVDMYPGIIIPQDLTY
jgi:predicted ATPase